MKRISSVGIGFAIAAASFAANADSTYQQECQTSRVNGRLQSVCTSSFDMGRGSPSRQDVVVRAKPKELIEAPRPRDNFCGLHFRMTPEGCAAD